MGHNKFLAGMVLFNRCTRLCTFLLIAIAIAYCIIAMRNDEAKSHHRTDALPIVESKQQMSANIGGKEIVLPDQKSLTFRVLPPSKNNPQIIRPIVIATFDDKSWFAVSAIKNAGIESLIHQEEAATTSIHSGKFAGQNSDDLGADNMYLRLSTASMAKRTKTKEYFFVVKDGILTTLNRHSDMYDQYELTTHSLKHKADRMIIHTYIEKPGYNMSSAMGQPNNRIVYMNIYRPIDNGWTLVYHYVGGMGKWEARKAVAENYAKNTVVR